MKILDGALGTSLQALGLPLGQPAESWLWTHPDQVVEIHTRFRDAGAEVICTATLCSLPGRSGWEQDLRRAVELARSVVRAPWLSLGPGARPGEAVQCVHGEVGGVILETFVDPEAGLVALADVRRVYAGPVVLSVVPTANGAARRGRSLPAIAEEALVLGAAGFGFNCMPAEALALAVESVQGILPMWCKPSAADERAWRLLLGRVDWLGGCCGTGPQAIARLSALAAAAEQHQERP